MALQNTFQELEKQYATSVARETEGVDIPLYIRGVPVEDTPIIVCARMGGSNRRYNALAEKSYRENKRRWERNQIGGEEAELLAFNMFMEACALGWKNVKEEGAPIPYDKEKLRAFLSQEKMRDTRSQLLEDARDPQRFVEDYVDEASGELTPTSISD